MYKLQAVCQLVTDLQTSVNEQYESAVVRQAPHSLLRHMPLFRCCRGSVLTSAGTMLRGVAVIIWACACRICCDSIRCTCLPLQCAEATACRREQLQEAREAKAFEAASKAKALVKTWKQPQLSAGQTSLPMELWGHVLEQMLPEACLWDLQAAAQQLCTVSMVSKGMYAAVQQQGWPQLCQLLSDLPSPPAMQRCKYHGMGQCPKTEKGQLPSSPDVLVTDPASLWLPELRAACDYFSLQATGMPALGRARASGNH